MKDTYDCMLSLREAPCNISLDSWKNAADSDPRTVPPGVKDYTLSYSELIRQQYFTGPNNPEEDL